MLTNVILQYIKWIIFHDEVSYILEMQGWIVSGIHRIFKLKIKIIHAS